MKWPIGALPAKLLVPIGLGVLALLELVGVPVGLLELGRQVLEGIPFAS